MFLPDPLRLVARALEDGTVVWQLLRGAIDILSDECRERVAIDVAIDNERTLIRGRTRPSRAYLTRSHLLIPSF
jgi:hypothetical protein